MKNTQLITQADIQLSKHFKLSEFTRSATAIKLGIENTPDIEVIEALQNLCIHVLEPLRERFGAIRITSGYRCFILNDAVGGSRTSQHMYGYAADIHVGNYETAKKYYNYVKDNLDFDQMLLEMKGSKVHCLHVSYKSDGTNRHKISSNYQII